jgi:hypothetical protein
VDCAGGTILLETVIAGEAVTILEDAASGFFCIGSSTVVPPGRIPTVPTAEPVFEESGLFGPEGPAWYTISLPEDFPDGLTAVDELGTDLITVRGQAADYLILIQTEVGQSEGYPAMTEKRVELAGADGEVLARVSFSGFGARDVAAVEEVTYEDFVACVNENGIDLQLPTVTGTLPPPQTPATREQLTAAWSACREVWAEAQRYQNQGAYPEFTEQRLFLDSCLADAGFFTMMGQPMDPDAFAIAYDTCDKQSPGRVALAECLEQAGLTRFDDGQVRGGPYPPELSSAAWESCRPIVVMWLYPPMMSPPGFMDAFDCAAEQGWIIPALGDSPNPPELPTDVRSACVHLP